MGIDRSKWFWYIVSFEVREGSVSFCLIRRVLYSTLDVIVLPHICFFPRKSEGKIKCVLIINIREGHFAH